MRRPPMNPPIHMAPISKPVVTAFSGQSSICSEGECSIRSSATSMLARLINVYKVGRLATESTVANAIRSVLMTFALQGTHHPTRSSC